MADMKHSNKLRMIMQAHQARRMMDEPEPVDKGERLAKIVVGLACVLILGGSAVMIYVLSINPLMVK